ncbi:MAG TPA: hypothetical protein VLC98_13025 [Phnomibacter sp.]|nr:hypothetical protein [Phnomibacter sp.]
MQNQPTYKDYFDEYRKSVSQIETDIRFWKTFLTMSIEKYKADNPVNTWISQSTFSLYNIPAKGKNMWLYSAKEISSIEIDDLTIHSNNFFVWVMNLCLIRMYNLVELLLFQAIRHKYFPTLADPIKGKKETARVIEQIKVYLKNNGQEVDTKNNKYIILFLRLNSTEIDNFYSDSVSPANWKTNWINFYEALSILRNVITHHGMLLSQSKRNEINSIAGDIFLHYFEQPINGKSTQILKPKDEQHFLNFINHVNDFAGNTIKFIAGQADLKFIGLHPA